MNKIILLFVIVLFSSCKQEYFFSNFNTVEYFKLKNDSLIDYEKTEDSIAIKILNDEYPFEINDKNFYEILNQQKFSRKTIKNEDVSNLREIFKPSFFITFGVYKCGANYRDILIFKENSSVVGIAKICFECKQYHFVGNNQNLNAEDFGNNEQFEELNKILKEYK